VAVPLGPEKLLLKALVEVGVVEGAGGPIGNSRPCHLLVILGDIDGAGNLASNGGEDVKVLPGEGVGIIRLNVQDANDAALCYQGDHQLALGLLDGSRDKTRFFGGVIDDLGLAFLGDPAREPRTKLNPEVQVLVVFGRGLGGSDHQFIGFFLQQEDVKAVTANGLGED